MADLCNRLYFIPIPGASPQRADPIEGIIEELNRHLLTASDRTLRAITRILLAAGTIQKAHAVHYFLTQGFRIGVLCTDSICASKLLDVADARGPEPL